MLRKNSSATRKTQKSQGFCVALPDPAESRTVQKLCPTPAQNGTASKLCGPTETCETLLVDHEKVTDARWLGLSRPRPRWPGIARLIAQKYDGSGKRYAARARKSSENRELIDNPKWIHLHIARTAQTRPLYDSPRQKDRFFGHHGIHNQRQ